MDLKTKMVYLGGWFLQEYNLMLIRETVGP